METKKRRVRRTPESYRREVSEITNGEYSVVGDFSGVAVPLETIHNTCGKTYESLPKEFVRGWSRCPHCVSHRKNRALSYSEVLGRVKSRMGNEYEVLSKFRRMSDEIRVKHLHCSAEWVSTAHSFVVSKYPCSKCYPKNSYRMRTDLEFSSQIRELVGDEYTFLGKYSGSSQKLKVRHNSCAYIYFVSPNTFINKGARCPKCASKGTSRGASREASMGPRRKTNEQFVSEVIDLVGSEFTFLEPYTDSRVKIKVRHNSCGKVYTVAPSAFLMGNRCPHCSGLIKLSDEEFKKRVYDLVGSEYKFLEPYVNTMTNIAVKHGICGRHYKVSPNSFFRGTRCPNCVYSRGEKAVADVLDSLSIEYTREHTFEYLGRKRYDFFIPSLNIAIEYDGKQHFEARDFFGGEEELKRTQESDALKNDFCDYMGIDLLRIPYWEFDNIDEIVTNFIDTVKLMRSISDRKEA